VYFWDVRKVASLFCFFSIVGLNAVFAQDRQLDSLLAFTGTYAFNDTIKVNALNALSEQYQWSNFNSSLHYAEQALAIAEQLHYAKGIATAKFLKGHCFWALGDSNIAIEMGLDASELGEQEKSESILVESYQVLARSYMDQTAVDKAEYYINRADSLAQKNKNWDQISRVYNLAGVIQFVKGRADSALLLYEKALAIAQENHLPKRNSARIVSNIGECHLRSNPDLAFSYFEKALAIARETGNRTVEAGTSGIVGVALSRQGKYKEAELYLKTALRLSRELGLKRVTRHAYSGLSELKAREGKTAEALSYLRNFYEVRDSLLNASKTRQIVELEARHELEKKEQAIRLLEQEQEIQKIWRNILIVALLFVILAAFLIYYSFRYREAKNQEILNLEIDYLTRQHKETVDKYKASLLVEENEEFESLDQKLLKRAITIVENNIGDSQFGVEKMALEMNMSRTNLHRRIKSITGFPPNELIRSIRLRKAARLILHKVDSVTQIALATGFDDYSYFSKAFKKHFGVSPSNYEEHHKLQGELDQELASTFK
jgi:AraC-like DNA-binding protein